MNASERLLTIEEVARMLRTSVHAVHVLRYRGNAPPALRVGRRLLFPADRFEAWLKERESEGVR